VLIASVMGSLHCAGMCGAFLALAVCGTQCSRREAQTAHAFYHLGRLSSYVTFGLIAGVLGSSLDFAAAFAGIQGAAAGIAASSMIVFGLVMLLRTLGARVPTLPLPAAWTRLASGMHRAALNQPPRRRALLIGVFTALLPCGWLWAFALVAAGTASPWRGALIMAVFWVGTLPMLVAMGASVRAVGGVFGRHMPLMASVAMTLAGVATLSMRVAMTDRLSHLRVDTSAMTTTGGIIQTAREMASQPAVCCTEPAVPGTTPPTAEPPQKQEELNVR
jgi:sulfite exporter TauE/SafE